MPDSDVIDQESAWDGTPSAEPSVKDFVAGIPVSERQMDWVAEKPVIDIGNINTWISNYGSAQIFGPEELIQPESDGPEGKVLVGGRAPALVFPSSVTAEVYVPAQIVREDPDIVLVWSVGTAGSGSENIRWVIEHDVVDDGSTPGASTTQNSENPSVPQTAEELEHTAIDLGTFSGDKGKTLSLRVFRDGTDGSDDWTNDVYLHRVEVR